MSLVWGVEAVYAQNYNQIDTAISETIATLRKNGLVTDGDTIVHIGSTPLELHGRTNMIKVSYV